MKKPTKIFAVTRLLLMQLLMIWSAALMAQDKTFEKITVKDGLTHNTVYDIAQDKNGFIWFGTREGLNKFDGKTIQTYYKEDGLSTNQINTLEKTSLGLLVGTGSGLDVFVPEKNSFKNLLSDQDIGGTVNSIIETKFKEVLVGTTNGLFKIDSTGNTHHLLKNIWIQGVEPFKTNVFWVVLHKKILLVNNMGERIREYQIPQSQEKYKDGSTYTILSTYTDSNNDLYVGTTRGLYYLSQGFEEFKYVDLSQLGEREAEVIRSITEDQDNVLWLGTESGVVTYNKATKEVKNYTQSFDNQPEYLSDKAVYSIFMSKENIIWIGTYFGGVNYTSPEIKGITTYSPSDYRKSISGKAISAITSPEPGKLWIGTEDGGINILDQKTNQLSYLNTSNGLSSNNVHAIHKDNQGNIWIGTFLGGLTKYRLKTGKTTHYKYSKNDPGSISNNNVYSILQDHSGRLFIGTQNGLNIYNYKTDRMELFMPKELGHKFIYDILQDRDHNLWFCTRNSGLFKLDNKTQKLTHFNLGSKELPKQIVSAYEIKNGDIWFGTLNKGVLIYDKTRDSLLPFELNLKLPNHNVYGILEDHKGKIWMSTNRGLSIYHPKSETLTHLNARDGLTTNQFNFKSFYKDKDGLLYFGSVNGLNRIDPDQINSTPHIPTLFFRSLKLFNKEVSIADNNVLDKHIDYLDHIKLKHNQDVISIDYGAIDFINEKSLKYAYKLDGFDTNWNIVGHKTTATYTNLPPGDYTFRIKTLPISNNLNERTIALSILPPFWKTDLAYGLYVLLLISLIYGYWRFVRFIHDQKLAVQLERMERVKISELNRHKLNFFTFISHEFKTPLTLIIASAEKYFKDMVTTSAPPQEIVSIKKSASKLNRLIQQLLEFRRIETEHAELDLRKGDIILFLKDTFMAFEPLLQSKNIDYQFKSEISVYDCYFDPSKLEMIVTNIISNSLKNTPPNGSIYLRVSISNSLDELKQSRIYLKFSDNGCGMSEQMTKRATEPFYQSNHEETTGNSGLGLALVKSLTAFLKGNLSIDSKLNKGTDIAVDFPLILKLNHDDKEDTKQVNGNKSLQLDALFPESTETADLLQFEKKANYKILIVEDNLELLKFLKKHFSYKFQVFTASDGEQALEKLKSVFPDIIISDLKMPKLSGIQLCKKIKTSQETKHIPFILLTAKNDESLRLKALSSGANSYIEKPFNLNELDLMVNNLLDTGKNLEKRFNNKTNDQLIPTPENNQDREFLRKIDLLVEEHYSNPNFGVESMAADIGISRSLLHLKMKKLTGLSTLDYIKQFRMKKAIRYLAQGKNISEVAFKVGYNDPNYFSRAFKKTHNMTPTAYATKNHNNSNNQNIRSS